MALVIFACLLLATNGLQAAAQLPLGAEFTDRPFAYVNIMPLMYSAWTGAGGNASTIDADGWPTEDAYAILFDAAPWINDPQPYIPLDFYGDYSLEFTGQADIIVGPNINATVHNVSFDSSAWRTRAVVTLAAGGTPGLALGFFNSRRTSSSPPNTGVSHVRLLQPGYSVWQGEVPVFTDTALKAIAPLQQLRFMTPLGTNNLIPNGTVLEWSTRRQWSDAVWNQPGNPSPATFGPSIPWEAVILLAQAVPGKDIWVNIHVACSGEDPSDHSSYVYQLATVLRDGNAYTGGRGLPPGTVLYVEWGNELWLNGTVGGPDVSYMWNVDAAILEVQAGGSPLNNDGNPSPAVWAQRRQLKRIKEIRDIFMAVLGEGGGEDKGPAFELRMVYGWFQDYVPDASSALTWLSTTYPTTPPHAILYGLAINAYIIVYPMPGQGSNDIEAMLLAASDAALPSRTAASSLVVDWNLTSLLVYEGMPAAIPALGNDDNSTWGVILETMRGQGIGPVMKYDVEVNWSSLPRAGARNFFALTSPYGPYPLLTWGLSEDLGNTTTPKWMAVKEMLGVAGGIVGTGSNNS